MRRFRCAALGRRLRLTVWRRQLCGGRRRCEDKCRDDREFVHIGRLRALLQHQSGQAMHCAHRLIPLARRTKGNRAAPWFVPRPLSSAVQLCNPALPSYQRNIAPPPDRHTLAIKGRLLVKSVGPANGGRWAVISVTDEGVPACKKGVNVARRHPPRVTQ